MFKTFYAGMDTLAPMVALGFFGVTFVAIVLRTMVFSRVTDFKSTAELPLHDEISGAPHE